MLLSSSQLLSSVHCNCCGKSTALHALHSLSKQLLHTNLCSCGNFLKKVPASSPPLPTPLLSVPKPNGYSTNIHPPPPLTHTHANCIPQFVSFFLLPLFFISEHPPHFFFLMCAPCLPLPTHTKNLTYTHHLPYISLACTRSATNTIISTHPFLSSWIPTFPPFFSFSVPPPHCSPLHPPTLLPIFLFITHSLTSPPLPNSPDAYSRASPLRDFPFPLINKFSCCDSFNFLPFFFFIFCDYHPLLSPHPPTPTPLNSIQSKCRFPTPSFFLSYPHHTTPPNNNTQPPL